MSLSSIANAGIIPQPVLYLLFLLNDTENEDSLSENPVTQLGSNVAFIFVL